MTQGDDVLISGTTHENGNHENNNGVSTSSHQNKQGVSVDDKVAIDKMTSTGEGMKKDISDDALEDRDNNNIDEGEEEEEEEEEPVLKYSRVGGSLASTIFKTNNDSASTLNVCEDYIVIGTHNGTIYVISLDGRVTKKFHAHTATIHSIAIDSEKEYIGSASVDGHVAIHSLTNPSEKYKFNMKRPVRAIALEPGYGKRSTRQFVCGGMGGQLIMHEKGWLGLREFVLNNGQSRAGEGDIGGGVGKGPIWSIAWQYHQFIAWANDEGVRVYDTTASSSIAFVSSRSLSSTSETTSTTRADLYRCSLYWSNKHTLLIAWGDTIKVLNLVSPKNTTNSNKNLVGKVTTVLKTDCIISSITPYPLNPPTTTTSTSMTFLVLAYITPDMAATTESSLEDHDTSSLRSKRSNSAITTTTTTGSIDTSKRRYLGAPPPELRIISSEGEELSSDILSLHDYHRFSCNDYWLVPISKHNPSISDNTRNNKVEEAWYVLSPNDLVVVQPRQEEDHLSWLIEKGKYEEALYTFNQTPELFKNFDRTIIGKKFLDSQIEHGNYQKAAQSCPSILEDDPQTWENIIFLYLQNGQINTIIPYVPTDKPRLGRLVYEVILGHFLTQNVKKLHETIHKWAPDLYDHGPIVTGIKAEIEHREQEKSDSHPSSTTLLMECLADLYVLHNEPGLAVPYFIKLGKPGMFDLIIDNDLYSSVRDHIIDLIEYAKNADRQKEGILSEKQSVNDVLFGDHQRTAIKIMTDHPNDIPINLVVKQLKFYRRHVFEYLNSLFKNDTSLVIAYADLQVELYAEFTNENSLSLMDFLRTSPSIDLGKAIKVCRKHDLIPELVYLLSKMGDNKQALTLIIERLGDVKRAIEFAREQNDDELWEDLLTFSESRPTFIRGLLENVGTDIHPIRLIRRIRDGLEIPGLRSALVKILQDFNLQATLMEGCQNIILSDCRSLSFDLNKKQKSAILHSGIGKCAGCSRDMPYARKSEPSQSRTKKEKGKSKEKGTINKDNTTNDEINDEILIVFYCRHVYHLSCALPDLPQYPPKPSSVIPNRAAVALGLEEPETATTHDQALNARLRYTRELRHLSNSNISCKLCTGRSR